MLLLESSITKKDTTQGRAPNITEETKQRQEIVGVVVGRGIPPIERDIAWVESQGSALSRGASRTMIMRSTMDGVSSSPTAHTAAVDAVQVRCSNFGRYILLIPRVSKSPSIHSLI